MGPEELKIKEFKKVSHSRKHRINNSLGVYDAYKYIRKNKWFDIGQSITEHQFYTIVRELNKGLVNSLLAGHDVKLPHRLGKLELRKSPTRVEIIDGKLVTSRPIDWDTTLKLWSEDKDAYNNKMLIRLDEKEVFKIHYSKKSAIYNNQSFYEFRPNRELKITLKDRIHNNEIDAFNLYE